MHSFSKNNNDYFLTESRPVYSYDLGVKGMMFRCFLGLYAALVQIVI